MRRFAILVSFLAAIPLYGQAARTFVASTGDDANPCSRSSPCRNFAAAVAAVADGGEVVVLDSAGYGPVTITKSVAIVAPAGVYAGISATSANVGVNVNAPGATVTLRGLTLNGVGSQTGIAGFAVGTLYIEGCTVSRFGTYGIVFDADGGKVFVDSSVVRDTQYGFIGGQSSVVSGAISNSRAENNGVSGFGLTGAYPAGNPHSQIAIRNSIAVSNGAYGFFAYASELNIKDCVSSKNGIGVVARDSGIAQVSNTMVVDNTIGFVNDGIGATFNSFGNNQLAGNATATTGTITTLVTQ